MVLFLQTLSGLRSGAVELSSHKLDPLYCDPENLQEEFSEELRTFLGAISGPAQQVVPTMADHTLWDTAA